jgi:hypothetical protein
MTATILTGAIQQFDEEEFEAFVKRIIDGGAVTLGDTERCSEAQWQRFRIAIFIDTLKHANAVFDSGRSRGRRGSMMVLQTCKSILEALIPESAEHLRVLDELVLALAACDVGELPYLFRPGVDADDHRKHLSIVEATDG